VAVEAAPVAVEAVAVEAVAVEAAPVAVEAVAVEAVAVEAAPVAVEAVAVEAAPVAVEAVAVVAAPVAVEAVAVEAAPVAVEALAVPPVEAGEPTDADRPPGIVVPRGEGPDDLKMISGVGPKIEGILHGLGIYHFDQIAQWSAREVAWVDKYLKFSGRIVRDDWVAQADALATGGADEYRRRFGKDPR
jgi:NADH-quinone oxidoreductase subunit E